MSNNNKKRNPEGKNGFIGRLFANTKMPAHVTEEQDWYLDSPDIRLTRVFTIVLILHVVAVGGIVAFKMIEKAAAPATALVEGASKAVAPSPETPAAQPPAATPAPAPAASAVNETPKTEVAARKDQEPVVMDHPSAEGHREYRVVIGDTVSSVARKMNVDEAELREMNQLGARDSLQSGNWLRLPKAATDPSKEPAASVRIADNPPKAEVKKTDPPKEDKIARVDQPAEKKAAGKPQEKTPSQARPENYKVQKGDTPYGIARRFGIGLNDLMAANGIDKPENLRAGQTVVIPKP